MTVLTWELFPTKTSHPGVHDLGIAYNVPNPHLALTREERAEARSIDALRRRHFQLLRDKIPHSGPFSTETWDDGSVVIKGAHVTAFFEVPKREAYSGTIHKVYELCFSSYEDAERLAAVVGFGCQQPLWDQGSSYWYFTMPKEIRDDSHEWREYCATKRNSGMSSGYKPTTGTVLITSYFSDAFGSSHKEKH